MCDLLWQPRTRISVVTAVLHRQIKTFALRCSHVPRGGMHFQDITCTCKLLVTMRGANTGASELFKNHAVTYCIHFNIHSEIVIGEILGELVHKSLVFTATNLLLGTFRYFNVVH